MKTIGMKVIKLTTVLAIGIAMFAGSAFAQSNDPFVGTWTRNIAKSSTTNPLAPTDRIVSQTSVWEVVGTGYKSTTVNINEKSKGGNSVTATPDGKDYPVTEGNLNGGDVVVMTRVDANTLHRITKKGSAITSDVYITVSADGKTRTIIGTGTNDLLVGYYMNYTVFDKQ